MLYHPLTAWEHRTWKTKRGKALIKFKNYMQYDRNYENWKRIELPCGQCIGCKMESRQDWAVRCILEAKMWDHNYFITLTYSEKEVPYYPLPVCIDKETGEAGMVKTLDKKHFTKFMKDLRAHYKYHYNQDNIRFFMCGEYGSQTQRPHYHRIIFNLPIFDLEPYFINKQHQQVWKSATLQKIWGRGIVSVGEVTYESRAYTRRYILKKQKINEIQEGQLPEYTNCSRMPGIRATYYKTNKEEIYKNDEITIKKALGRVINRKPPDYFDRLFDEDNEERMAEIKEKRRAAAQDARERKLLNTSLDADEALRVAERNYRSKIATLKRGLKEDDY